MLLVFVVMETGISKDYVSKDKPLGLKGFNAIHPFLVLMVFSFLLSSPLFILEFPSLLVVLALS